MPHDDLCLDLITVQIEALGAHDRYALIEPQIEALGLRDSWRIARFAAGHLMRRVWLSMTLGISGALEATWRAITRTASSAYGTLAFGALSIAQSGVIIALAWR